MQKWHPDKQKDDGDSATSRFQEINEAYQGNYLSLSVPFGLCLLDF